MSKELKSGIVMEDDSIAEEVAKDTAVVDARTEASDMPESGTAVRGSADQTSVTMPAEGAPQSVAGSETHDAGDDKLYSQAEVDAWQAQWEKEVERYKEQAQKAKDEVAAEKEKYTKSCAWHHRKDAIEKRADSLVGDGGYAKICELKAAYVTAQMEADAKGELEKKLKEVETSSQSMSHSYNRLLKENGELGTEKRALEKENVSLKTRIEELDGELQKTQKDLANWKSMGARMKGSFVPQCFVSKEWFERLFADVKSEISKDPPSDAAILLMASIAEFAIMERSSADLRFDLKKQLSDIGLYVAYYMHQKCISEDETVKMLRNFEKALRESPIVSKFKISLKVPERGPDFNVDEVIHLKKGSSVDRIHNWCIISPVGVEMKAIVE